MSTDSEDKITATGATSSGEHVVVRVPKDRPKHWTTALPLWGIFGALVACTWFAAQLNADQKNMAGAVEKWMAAADKREEARDARVEALAKENQETREWRIKRDTEAAVIAAMAAQKKTPK